MPASLVYSVHAACCMAMYAHIYGWFWFVFGNIMQLVYADLEVTNQSRRAAPVAPRGIGSAYPAANDNEPVMYSTVQ